MFAVQHEKFTAEIQLTIRVTVTFISMTAYDCFLTRTYYFRVEGEYTMPYCLNRQNSHTLYHQDTTTSQT